MWPIHIAAEQELTQCVSNYAPIKTNLKQVRRREEPERNMQHNFIHVKLETWKPG